LGFSRKQRIDISYSIDDVKAIRVELKDGLLLDEQSHLCVRTTIDPSWATNDLREIETQAAELAQFFYKDLLLTQVMYKNSSGFATNQNQIARPIERIGIIPVLLLFEH
jgi:hypothetical protein